MSPQEMLQEPQAKESKQSSQIPPPKEGRLRNLIRRLISSAFLISAVLATLFLLPIWGYALVVGSFITIGLYEFFTIVRNRGILVNRMLGVGLGIVFTVLVAWRSLVQPGLMVAPVAEPGPTLMSWMWDVFWPATIVLISIRQIVRENTFEALSGLATTLFGLAYVAALFSYFYYIRAMDGGAELVLYLLLVTKMSDAGAYFVGNLLGKHPLVPRISPRKTVEGFIGAALFSSLTALLSTSLLGGAYSPLVSLILGFFLGICAQLGDLVESLIKRDCQVKDTGVIPGLGGILDVIDSLLFTAPLFYGFLIYG